MSGKVLKFRTHTQKRFVALCLSEQTRQPRIELIPPLPSDHISCDHTDFVAAILHGVELARLHGLQFRDLTGGSSDAEMMALVITSAIDVLDVLDADADMEDDDPAGQDHEDEFSIGPLPHGCGPGCPISDPDIGIDDQPQGTRGLDC